MQTTEIAREILAYLAEHPEAQDTLDGTIQWWLLERKSKYQTDIVRKALAELVAKEFLLEWKARDDRIHYRVNQNKYDEIQAFLKKSIFIKT